MNKNKKVSKKRILTYDNQFRTLSIKVYDEQMPDGWEAVKKNIRIMDKSLWQVIGICHDRDPVGDDFWTPAIEKPHYHIIIRVLNNKRMRVRQALNALGIVFRPELDKSLWENHGVESCRDYTDMTVYITHDTEQAIFDGKEQYALEEIVSNLTPEEIKQIREGYTRVSESLEKVTPRMMAELDKDAYELGRKIGNFEKWYRSLPFNVRKNAGMRTVKESYEMGKAERLEELQEGAKIPRLCVYIQGDAGLGKSYAAKYAMQQLGQKFLNIGEGTGKFDKLKETHGAIIVDDTVCPNLLQMADTSITDAHKRCNGNPLWVGEYLIVTSNDQFEDWLDECGFRSVRKKQAARDRFYICELVKVEGSGRNRLDCIRPAERGDDDLSQEIDDRYKAFCNYYNESLAEYHSKGRKKSIAERLASLNEYIATPDEIEAYNKARATEIAAKEAAEEEKRRAEEARRVAEEAAKKAAEERQRREEQERVEREIDKERRRKKYEEEYRFKKQVSEEIHDRLIKKAQSMAQNKYGRLCFREYMDIYLELDNNLRNKAINEWQQTYHTRKKSPEFYEELQVIEIEKRILDDEESKELFVEGNETEFDADTIAEFEESCEETPAFTFFLIPD